MIGLFVELGVQRDDAAVRVLELTVEAQQLVLPRAQLVEGPEQLLVLQLDFFDGPARREVRR